MRFAITRLLCAVIVVCASFGQAHQPTRDSLSFAGRTEKFLQAIGSTSQAYLHALKCEIEERKIDLSFLLKENPHQQKILERLFEISELRSVNLSYNDLSDIPTNITHLHEVFDLNLDANKLVRAPTELLELKKLVYLSLNDNPLSDLTTLSKLSDFEVRIDIFGRSAKKTIPAPKTLDGKPYKPELFDPMRDALAPRKIIKVPKPDSMNEAWDDVEFMLECRRQEAKGVLNDDYQERLFRYLVDAIESYWHQVFVAEPVTKNVARHKEQFARLAKEIHLKYAQRTLSVNTVLFTSLKLSYYADAARCQGCEKCMASVVACNRQPDCQESLLNAYSSESLRLFLARFGHVDNALPFSNNFGSFACYSLDELEASGAFHAVIPIIKTDGIFGIHTWLYALLHGGIILPFAVNNTSDVHMGTVKSFACLAEYFGLPALKELSYKSSVTLLEHDLKHAVDLALECHPVSRSIANFRRLHPNEPLSNNPYDDIKSSTSLVKSRMSLFRKAYRRVLSSQKISNPDAIAFLLFMLFHEQPYVLSDKYHANLEKFIKIQNDYDLLLSGYAESSGLNPHALSASQISLVEHRILTNRFDDFQALQRILKAGVVVDKNNLRATLKSYRKNLVAIYKSDKKIKRLLDKIYSSS